MNDRRKDDPRLEDMHEKIVAIHEGYFGNGKKGLKTIVAQHAVLIKVLCGVCVGLVSYIGAGKLFAF